MNLTEFKNEIILLSMLKSSTKWTVKDIAKQMGRTSSTVLKHFKALEDMDFVIDGGNGVYELKSTPKGILEFSNLVYFTEEQAYIVHDIVSSMCNDNEMKYSLLKTLAGIYGRTNLSEFTFRKESSRDIATLREAIIKKKKVILKKYSSSNSGTIRNRIVEPFKIMDNFIDIWAYEPESRKNKIFRISRIEEVVLLDEDWTDERRHEELEADCFRCYGKEWDRVILRLDTRAKNLLTEEFPAAKPDLKSKGKEWILDTRVRDMKGVGRFVIGVLKDVKIISGDPLKEYVRNYMKEAGTYLD